MDRNTNVCTECFVMSSAFESLGAAESRELKLRDDSRDESRVLPREESLSRELTGVEEEDSCDDR